MALEALRSYIPVIVKEANAAARLQLVAKAKEENQKVLEEQKARNGYYPQWEGFGDMPGRPIEQAQEQVVYKYTYLLEIVPEILKALRDASPSESGRYKAAHGLFINGEKADPNTPITPGMDFFIANPMVYARRLEVGKTTSGRDFLISKPNHIYERTQKKFAERYRNAVKITMGYVTMPSAWQIQGKLPSHYVAKGGKVRKRRPEVGGPVRSPAIFFTML